MMMKANREKLIAKILIVDDRNENLFAMGKILKTLECEIYKAQSGNEALSFTLRHDFSLILLDVNMPEMNGFELAGLLHENHKTKQIPIIFVTAINKEDTNVFKGYESGAVDFLFKPIDMEILLRKAKIFIELDLRKKELEAIQIELKESNDSLAGFKSIVENSSEVYMIADQAALIKYVSPSVKQVFGFSPEQLLGKNAWHLQTPEERKRFNDDEQKIHLNLTSNNLVETKMFDHNENIRTVESSISDLTHLPNIRGMVLTIRDITEKKKNEKLISHMAFHDYTTDLPNRRALELRLETIFAEVPLVNQGPVLIKIALDQYQIVIDTLGNKNMDILIKTIVKRLNNLLNKNQFLARIGETEFGIIVQHQTDCEYLKRLSRLIISAINEAYFLNGYELYITANIGISRYQRNLESYDQLVQNADTALSIAQAAGRNKIEIFSASMDIKSFKHFSISNDIRKVLERNELHIVYQPIVDLHSRQKIVGAEALLRWHHPEWGIVSPSEFIPIAEETGMIIAIGNWVLRMACELNQKWKQEGLPPIRISVNFSPQQFMQENFIEIINTILKETEMDPYMLEIEITESLFIHDVHRVSEIIQELRGWGIRFALDDFGTGYSSLSLLSEFKMDTLKIDKSFIRDFETDVKRANLIEAMINIGHIFELNVVCEGIENIEQYTLLQKFGSNEMQGYFISRPLEQSAFRKLLKQGVVLSEEKIIKGDFSDIKNRRKLFRTNYSNCLLADMTVDSFYGKKLSLGSTEVLIRNFGPGGLCFLLHVRLPIGNELMLKFEMKIQNKTYTFFGKVVWTKEIEENQVFEYGIKFLMEDVDRDTLTSELNNVELLFRNSNLAGVSQAYIGDPYKFVKEHK